MSIPNFSKTMSQDLRCIVREYHDHSAVTEAEKYIIFWAYSEEVFAKFDTYETLKATDAPLDHQDNVRIDKTVRGIDEWCCKTTNIPIGFL